jgi:hypothetical protein
MDYEMSPEPIMDPAERHRRERQAVEEAGGGVSEGFELAEQELIEHASHGDDGSTYRISRDAGHPEEQQPSDSVYGEGDHEHTAD